MDQTVKDKVRCHFMIDNHHRCKRNTIIYSYFCWQHTIKKEHLKLEPSLIAGAGKGLFTTAPLKKGDVIRYSGQMLTKAQFEQRYPLDNADYVIQLGANRFLDGRSTQNQLYSNPPGKKPTLGRWVNSNAHSHYSRNVKITHNSGNMKLTKNVPAGRELFTSYGNQYHI